MRKDLKKLTEVMLATSSPHVAPIRETNLHRTSTHHPSDATGGLFLPDIDFPMDQQIDLGLDLEMLGDTSISGPSGRAFELPDDGVMLDNAGRDM